MELVPYEEMARMLKKKRQRNGVKQKKIASLTDLSPSQVNRIENQTTNPTYQSVYSYWKAVETLENRDAETAEELMNTPVNWVEEEQKLEEAITIMKEKDFSQLPVKGENGCTGRITESEIMNTGEPDKEVREIMGPPLMEIQPEVKRNVVKEMLKDEPAVLVNGENKYTGIITKADLL